MYKVERPEKGNSISAPHLHIPVSAQQTHPCARPTLLHPCIRPCSKSRLKDQLNGSQRFQFAEKASTTTSIVSMFVYEGEAEKNVGILATGCRRQGGGAKSTKTAKSAVVKANKNQRENSH